MVVKAPDVKFVLALRRLARTYAGLGHGPQENFQIEHSNAVYSVSQAGLEFTQVPLMLLFSSLVSKRCLSKKNKIVKKRK